MSKHNYTQYSNKAAVANRDVEKPAEVNSMTEATAAITEPIIEPAVTATPVAPVKPVLVEETVETVAMPETVPGVVANCSKLNVRAKATMSSEIVCVLDAASEIEINVARSTGDWFYVYTAVGAEGYCMRKFVNAHL